MADVGRTTAWIAISALGACFIALLLLAFGMGELLAQGIAAVPAAQPTTVWQMITPIVAIANLMIMVVGGFVAREVRGLKGQMNIGFASVGRKQDRLMDLMEMAETNIERLDDNAQRATSWTMATCRELGGRVQDVQREQIVHHGAQPGKPDVVEPFTLEQPDRTDLLRRGDSGLHRVR